ncbi:CDP-glucose 4,6-dehydratase [Cupriavidus basilensis OR16]|uniref:CDP-glucose 4,6-dehydratase n=1 Tax=Cupriavidus basilensis OR16 TaxID=1127483 RepID=H1RY58_9BURK|nr:CDP-glucose 4,6-dehydratase [Cupriavidus basilensis]EHP44831.1 CDP-glucose 4,6-dehydratase [Cupriavidus basilensis OR16]
MHALSCYTGRSVFLTGHTGFKGSWMAMWLSRLGARVSGYALPCATSPALFTLADVEAGMHAHHHGDVRDQAALTAALHAAQPEIIFHLAAQPLVRASYDQPVQTWATNVMGTVHLLEAVRACPSVRAVVVVTTDKSYENREWLWGYRETDPLGGHDPYSASKAGAELVAASYRQAFLARSGVLVATARAGNVIGGGDWSMDRLIADAARAAATAQPLRIRSPEATRPWQHVLESLHGYLLLGERLWAGEQALAEAFNFGPAATDNLPVAEVLTRLQVHWPGLQWEVDEAAREQAPHEARYLYLDSAKARQVLSWRPRWTLDEALAATAEWYGTVQRDPHLARRLSEQQLDRFCS